MLECVNVMAPGDEDLIKYALDDEPLKLETRDHLDGCSICQRRLARYQNLETALTGTLYRSQCPSATKLNFYCAGQLSPDEVMNIVEHLEYCPLCANDVKEIRHILASFEPFPEVSEPPPVQVLRRIIAALVPMRPQLVTRGVIRGASNSTSLGESDWPRQYRAEGVNISLHLSRTSSGEIMLLGLFTSDGDGEDIEALEGAVVDLYLAEQGADSDGQAIYPLMTAHIDDLGSIAFRGIASGEYNMIVRLVESELVIKGLKIPHG